MNEQELGRIEASIPVQSRVNLVDLANLVKYWESEGYRVRTMSQLVSWSITLLCDILRANEKLVEEIETAAEANNFLEMMRLYQPSMKSKGFRRIGAAIRFESMREEGMNPKIEDPRTFNTIHNKHSIREMTVEEKLAANERFWKGKGGTAVISDEEYELSKKIKEREDKTEYDRQLDKVLNHANKVQKEEMIVKKGQFNNMSEAEFAEYQKKKDREQIERENAPIDWSQVKTVKE